MINSSRLIETFFDLVRIDCPTGGELRAAEYVVQRLRALGAAPVMDGMCNVTASFSGVGKPILLSAHLDSVDPCRGIQPRIVDGMIRSDGTTVLGADDRSGVAAILEALTILRERDLAHVPVEVVFTVQEEPGLKGAQALDYRFESEWGVVFDSHGPVGTVVLSAPGADYLDLILTGRAAHAGAEPEKGISAVLVAAEAINALPWGRLDAETTANIGVVHAGSARNAIPELCTIQAEVRSRKAASLARRTRAVLHAFERAARHHRARLDVQLRHAYQPYRHTARTPIVRHVSAALERIGRVPRLGVAGGGSDANEFNLHGISCVAVSNGPLNLHSTQEHIPVLELVKCAELALEVMRA